MIWDENLLLSEREKKGLPVDPVDKEKKLKRDKAHYNRSQFGPKY